jgi:peptide/nickel transport system substrate-binding protein
MVWIKRHNFWINVLVAAVVFLATTSSWLIAKEDAAESKSSWVWTKEFPKPASWKWDESYWPTKPVRGGYLREARYKYIGFMNPNHWPCNDYSTISKMYEFILQNGGDLRPSLPSLNISWEYKDPVTVIMNLRKGVQFHDGSEFNAESLKYQIEWILNKKNGAFSRAWIQPVKSIDVVDEYTVRWHFTKPWAAFIPMMAYVPGYAMSAKALKGAVALREATKLSRKAKIAGDKAVKAEKKAQKAAAKGGEKAKKAKAKAEKALKAAVTAEEKARRAAAEAKGAKVLDTHPIGTGKFMFEEASPGNFLKLKRNPNWWFGKTIGRPDMPYFDGVKVLVIPDPAIQLANFRAAKLDRMTLHKYQYAMIKDDPKFNIYVFPKPDLASFHFNNAKGPCRDIRVRKAISHAIDRKALIHGTQFGLARIASCLYPEDHFCHNPDLKPVAYDPELSKKLLAEAGYEKGLTLTTVTYNDPESQMRSEALKAMLANVGVDLKVDSLDPVAATDRLVNLEFDLMAWNYYYIYDPDSIATTYYHPDLNNKINNNKRAVALVEAGREEINLDKRIKIYHELEKVVYDNFLDLWLWWEKSPVAHHKYVQGFNLEMYWKDGDTYGFTHPLWFKDGKPSSN